MGRKRDERQESFKEIAIESRFSRRGICRKYRKIKGKERNL